MMKSKKYNRLENKQETATTFRRYDENGMFESIKEETIFEDGKLNKKKIWLSFLSVLGAFLLCLFSSIFVIRLAFSIPL